MISVAGGANTYYGQQMTLNAGLAPGAYSVTATYAPDTAGWYQAGNSPVAINFNVVKAGQTVSINDPGAKTAGGTPFAVTASATSALPVTLSSPTPAVCTIAGNTVTLTGAGTCTINGDQAGNGNYNAAPTATLNIAVGIVAQTISFTDPGSKTFGAAPFALTATASSGLPVAFASTTTGVCTVSGATVTLVSGGSCSITAAQAGNASYAAATPVTRVFAVGTGGQTISFTRPADRAFVSGGSVPLTASATSGLAVSFASNSMAICTVAGSVATMIAAGQCSITASQAGNASYAAAAPVTQTFAQTQMTTSTTLTSSANPIFLNQPFTLTAVVTASESTPPPGRTRQAAPAPLAGTVTFAMGGTTLCGGVALSGGVAVCNTAITTPGSQTIVATYSGGGSYGVSTSNIVAQTVVDQRAKTAQVVGRFMGQRTNLLASNEPDGGRQIDRLMEAGDQGGTQGAGLADNPEGERSMRAATSSRLGAGADAGDIGRMRLGARTDRPLQDSFAGGSQRDDNPFPADTSAGRTIDTPQASGGSLAAGPLRFSGSTDGAARFGFSTSLRDVARHAAQAEADKSGDAELGLGGRSGRAGGKARPNPFDIWAEGKYADFRDDRRNRDLDGHFGLFSAGADYVLRPNLLLGALVQFDSMSQTSEKDRTKVRGEGWMAGPYATLRLSPNVFWQMRAAWGRSSITSFMADRIGQQITGDKITIYDDPHQSYTAMPFDLEGFPRKKVTFIDKGIVKDRVYNHYLATKHKTESTGHSIGFDGLDKAMPLTLSMEPGTKSAEVMLDSMKDGILITRFHYVNGLLDTRQALFTGMTRDGTFRIKNGKIEHGIKNLRFTESMLEAFKRVIAISKERELYLVVGISQEVPIYLIYLSKISTLAADLNTDKY